MTRTPKSSEQNMRDKHAGNACPTETVTFQRQKVDPDNETGVPVLRAFSEAWRVVKIGTSAASSPPRPWDARGAAERDAP